MESQEQGTSHGRRADNGSASFGARVDRVSHSAQDAWKRTRDALDDMKTTIDIQGRVRRHPYGTLAAALGIGYVLGGGLFSRLTGRVLGLGLRTGLRLAALPLLKDELFGLAEALGKGAADMEADTGPERRRRTKKADENKEMEP
jgi:hypothetical protein